MTGSQDEQPDFSIVVVNWNTGDYLRECLQSIVDEPNLCIVTPPGEAEPEDAPQRRRGRREESSEKPLRSLRLCGEPLLDVEEGGYNDAKGCHRHPHGLSAEVIVVDNASTDGSADMVRAVFPQVTLLANRHNAGFAAANNQAIAQACGHILFLLNPDAYLRPGALAGLAGFFYDHPEAAAAGPNVLNPDGTWQAAAFRFPTLWDLLCEAVFLSVLWPRSPIFARKELGGFQRDAVREVDWVQGCALAVRREVWDAVGPFDEGYWMYVEELDWCRRAKGLGYRIFFTPGAQVVHYGKRATARARAAVLPLGFSSHFRYFRKFDGPGVELAARLIALLQMGLRAAISAGMVLASRGAERSRWQENWRAYTGVMREALRF